MKRNVKNETVRQFFSHGRSQEDINKFFEEIDVIISKEIMALDIRNYYREDFRNDVIVKLLELPVDRYEERGHFESWLSKVIKNLYLEKLKKNDFKLSAVEYKLTIDNDNYWRKEALWSLVNKHLEDLTDKRRRAIEMVFFEKKSQKEICQKEGILLCTHNKRLSQAKKNSKNCSSRQELMNSCLNEYVRVGRLSPPAMFTYLL